MITRAYKVYTSPKKIKANLIVAQIAAISGRGDSILPKSIMTRATFSTASILAANHSPHARRLPKEARGHPVMCNISPAHRHANAIVVEYSPRKRKSSP